MKHLAPEEIMHLADVQIANGSLSAERQHIEACPICRRELEFQRSVRSAAGKSIITSVSKDFTSAVLAQIAVRSKAKRSRSVADHVGGLFALLMVIGLFGIIVTNLPSFESSQAAHPNPVRLEIGRFVDSLLGHAGDALKPLPEKSLVPGNPETKRVLGPIVIALVILGVLDGLLRRRFNRLITRR